MPTHTCILLWLNVETSTYHLKQEYKICGILTMGSVYPLDCIICSARYSLIEVAAQLNGVPMPQILYPSLVEISITLSDF